MSPLTDYLSYNSADPQKNDFVKSDNAFTRKARLLQATWRKESGAARGSLVKNGVTYYHPNKEIER